MKRHLLTVCFAAVALAFAALLLATTGCGKEQPTPAADSAKGDGKGGAKARAPDEDEAEIKAVRAKLAPADRALVEAQDYCPIMADQRLGSMGAPFKVMIQDQPVYLCCKGCRTRAMNDPEKTLAKVKELKAKKPG